MATYIIQYERKSCIGAGVCAAVNPDNFVMNKDGKADLMNSTLKDSETMVFEKEMDEGQLANAKMAAEGCPVNVIHIINKDTGEKII